FAGVAADEFEDPRPTAEFVRQWSTDHPEFAFLPRKFKFAVTGSENDRAVTKFHDIGLRLVRNATGAPGYEVSVGGGLGRTPMIGKVLRKFLPRADLLPYMESILQVYNQIGRRDNKYKARIKITLHEHGIEDIRRRVEEIFSFQRTRFDGVDQDIFSRIQDDFEAPLYKQASTDEYAKARESNPLFRSFTDTNVHAHKNSDFAIVTVSLKAHGATPGDASSAQMRVLADIAEKWSLDELRVSHEQNIILPHVHKGDLPVVYNALQAAKLATANIGLISDVIACPGLDYCDLATARSINVAQGIATRFDELKLEHDIGHVKVKISGCINACGHHHVGHIGILGLEKSGIESYQITLGGDGTETAAIGKIIGPGFKADEIIPAVERLITAYLELRLDASETFLITFRRLGPSPFKAALYPAKEKYHAA
ncbi:MAG: nitrite/sulfite reductase, partial [Paracoccaceae bacterium]